MLNFVSLKKYGIALLLAFTSLVTISPARLSLWQLSDNQLQSAVWQQANPLSSSLQPPEVQMKLANGSVTLQSPLGSWESPDTWQVQQAVWTDLNHDGNPEMTLLVRRPFEPWPVDRLLPHAGRIQAHQDVDGMSSHIIMIGWKKDHWGEIWAGSALARPVQQFQAADMDADGKQELVVLEGSYTDKNSPPARSLAVWQWDGFSFELISRLDQTFSQIAILKSSQNFGIILVN